MNERIRYLDGLRGILAIVVFWHHYFYIFCPDFIFGGNYQYYQHNGPFSFYKLMALTPLNIFFNPGMAIHFFFLLSGYVQTKNYFLKPNIVFLQKSLFKRYFRLALPTLAVVVLVYFSHSLFLIRKDLIPVNELSATWLKSLLPNNLHFFEVIKEGLIESFRHNSRYYQILWTMPTELVNSFFILFLLLALHNTKHQVKIIVALMIIEFVVLREYYGVAFLAGLLFAKLETDSDKFRKVLTKPYVHYPCLLVGLYFGSYPFTGYQNSTAHSVYAPISFFDTYPHVISYLIGIILMFCFLLVSKPAQNLLSKKLLLFFGEISFMFYLIHFLLLLSVAPLLYNALMSPGNAGFDLISVGLLSFATVTIAAYVLTLLVDRPVIKACNFFVKEVFSS